MVGCLQYLSCLGRPDIANAVREVEQQQNAPTEEHQRAAKGKRYLRGTADYGIQHGGLSGTAPEGTLYAYVDAAYAKDLDTRRSTTGLLMMFSGGPIAWKSQR